MNETIELDQNRMATTALSCRGHLEIQSTNSSASRHNQSRLRSDVSLETEEGLVTTP